VSDPQPLFEAWDAIAPAIAATRDLAVLSDFDGVLAEIRRQPEDVEMRTPMRDALLRLRDQGTLVGVVSGRRLADVRKHVNVPGICYGGCHGYMMQDSRGRHVSLVDRDETALLARVRQHLAPKLHHLNGINLEVKEAGLTVHYRAASPAAAQQALVLVREAAATDERLQLLDGKKVWEILPGARVNKWTAVRVLLALEDRSDALLVYIGDDATDERVFERMRGISVAVGKTTDTAAEYFVQAPSDVRQFLERIAERRG
jgi:trehalose-phosphatase